MKSKLILFIGIWFFGLTIIFFMNRLTAPISLLIYWVILGQLIFTVWLFRVKNHIVLLFSLGLFILAGFLTILGVQSWAEIVMKVSLLGWLIGIVRSLFSDRASNRA